MIGYETKACDRLIDFVGRCFGHCLFMIKEFIIVTNLHMSSVVSMFYLYEKVCNQNVRIILELSLKVT